MVKSDTVQLDSDILKEWSAILELKEIGEVEVETLGGKTERFKAKEIKDSRLENKGLIRIPGKSCQALDVKEGELVRVKPVKSEKTKDYDPLEVSSVDVYPFEMSSLRI